MAIRLTHMVIGAAALCAAAALAYDSPAPLALIPPHEQPWVKMVAPEPRTRWLWSFDAAGDKSAALDDLLEAGALPALDGPGGSPTLSGGASGPKLASGAQPAPDGGFIGGGLALDGTGFATGDAGMPSPLVTDGGLTVDLWFRADAAVAAGETETETVLVVADARGKPWVSVARTARGAALRCGGETLAEVPLFAAVGRWHHLAFVMQGTPDAASAVVTVDDRSAGPVALPRGTRPGTALYVGGAPELRGLRGFIDEARLTRGIKHFYPWSRGVQEGEIARQADETKTPFFKTGRVVTRFRFDGALDPEAFSGRSWSGKADASHFKPGLKGQALDLSRIDQTGFAMKGFEVLPEKEGTVEFWFRPLDWNNFYLGEYHGTDLKYYWLMTLTAQGTRYATPSKNVEVIRGRACRDADLHWAKIHPGTWTHALIAVKDGATSVYLNGQRQRLWQVGLVTRGHPHAQEPLKAWRERTGGKDVDDTWTWAFVKSPTLIDEFSVFSWGMDAEEAWNAYARWMPQEVAALKPLPLFRTNFDYYAHSWDLQEKLVAKLACLPVAGVTPASADLVLRDAAGAELLNVEKQPLDETGSAAFTLKRALPFGRYPAVVRSRDAAGAVLKEEASEYVRAKPAWIGNTLGKDRTVPEPWTPVTVEGNRVGIVGRAIELGANGLPARLETIGNQLLKAPASIRVRSVAGAAELTGKGPAFTERAPDRAVWQAALTGGGLSAEVKASLEFDGLLYCAVTLKPATGAEAALDELVIDFPLAPEHATQLLANGGGSDFRASWIARTVPEGEGSVWRSLDKPYPAFGRAPGMSNFMPHIWLGADEVGLYFGAENDQGWTVDGPRPAQEIVRENDAVIFRMNIIREPTVIPATGRRFHFVLLPTPAKPEPPDWRKQMALGGVNFGSCDSFGGFDMKTDPADPGANDSFLIEPRSWEHAAKMAPQSRDKWGRCILYADASWTGLGPNFRDWRHDMWAGTGRIAWTPEFEDYAVWAINEFLERGLIDGVYWDDVSVGNTLSLASTAYEHAASPNGRRVGFTALAQRRVNLRLWRLFVAAGKEPCIWAHMTVCYEVPLFSFCRYLSNCEFVTGVEFPGKRDAIDMWSPQTLRLLGGSAKWGTGYHNLSTLPRSMPPTAIAEQWWYPQQRTEDGLYAANDIFALSGGLVQALNKTGFFEATPRVWPWWKADQVMVVEAPEGAKTISGVYGFEDKAVVFVVNLDRVEREVTVRLTPGDGALFPGAGGAAWRDIDPGLKPPAQVAVGTEAVGKLKPGGAPAGSTDHEGPLDDDALTNMLEGTTPEDRDLKRLELRTEGDAAHLLLRPRDYRVLEVRPK